MSAIFLEGGHVTSPQGWQAATTECGIKYSDRDDLGLLLSDRPCVSAAMFTTNRVKAAPVLYDMALMQRNPNGLRAVVLSAGNANACTGPDGEAAAETMGHSTETALNLPSDTAFVMSTGTIGLPMPVDLINRGIQTAAAGMGPANGPAFAKAIMTTDTRPKFCAVQVTFSDGRTCTIGGVAKGVGMIHPNMATLLSILTTDATLAPIALDAALRSAVEQSFHSISIDGDTSTNDTVLAMANGIADAPVINAPTGSDYEAFRSGLTAVCQYLAQEVVRDGEGATRFVTIHVRGARDNGEAKQAAMTIARSPLVKTALFGADPNWGRVLCALGYSGAEVDPGRIALSFGGLPVIENGMPLDFDEAAASDMLDQAEVTIDADLGLGTGDATVWTCDFSYGYIKINAEYRT
jgi:glutamate N-acetyltransferase/amino-acid N-acetyltransferase